jgi:hypothetical protein
VIDEIAAILTGLDQMEAAANACISADWNPAVSNTDSLESAAEWAAETARNSGGDKMYMVLSGNGDDTRAVAVTGNGEYSKAHAEYLTYVCPRNILVLIEIARHALTGETNDEA